MPGCGVFVLMVSVWPSAVIESYSKNVLARGTFSKTSSMDDLTASAVRGSPFENFTPSRILNVQVSLSSATLQLSASHGCVSIFSSNFVRLSPRP